MPDSVRKRAEALYFEVMDLTEEARSLAVERACASDAALRAEVEALLNIPDEALDGFLDAPDDIASARADTDDATLTPTQIGRYQVIRKIGEGGMGVVYEARQDNPQRTVAVKVIRLGLASERMLRRFQHEADVLGQLQHPGIAHIYEAGTAAVTFGGGTQLTRAFFAMELVQGLPLDIYVAQTSLTVRARLELLARICDAVQHAHQKGVIHRDLKPANILVDESGQPKVLDFGVARVMDRSSQSATLQTDTGQLIGTLAYMSPEQVSTDSLAVDTRSDVYALGVILYELLSGHRPYDLRGTALPEAARIIREQNAARLSTIDRALRGDLETITSKAMAKDRTMRYGAASDLAEDLRRYVDNQPILARLPSTAYLIRKFARRHAGITAAAVTVILTLIGATAFSAAQYAQATRDRDRAQDAERWANVQAAKARQVATFMTDMLQGVGPAVALGRDTTLLREILDDTAARLDRDLRDQPEVEVTLRSTLGRTYLDIGALDAAETHLQGALVLARDVIEADARQIASRLGDLADLQRVRGEYAAADVLYEKALELMQRDPSDTHADVAALMSGLAATKRYVGAFDEAEELFRQALEIRRAASGDDDALVAEGEFNLATLLHAQGDVLAAEPLYRKSLATLREQLGAVHPKVTSNLNNLAILLLAKGDLNGAEPFYREALAARRQVYGDEHPKVAASQAALAELLLRKGELEEAEHLFRHTLALRRKLLGEVHPAVAMDHNSLGAVLHQKGELDEAESHYRKALAMRREIYGNDHADVAISQYNLGVFLHDKGSSQAWVAEVRRGAESVGRALGPDHHLTAMCRSQWGAYLTELERYPEAEHELRAAYCVSEAALGSEHQQTQEVVERLIALYERWAVVQPGANHALQAAHWRHAQQTTDGAPAPQDASAHQP
jgi:tetratricopeptide (TPR) repeat protein/predicted Ser/Thr protein kinase